MVVATATPMVARNNIYANYSDVTGGERRSLHNEVISVLSTPETNIAPNLHPAQPVTVAMRPTEKRSVITRTARHRYTLLMPLLHGELAINTMN